MPRLYLIIFLSTLLRPLVFAQSNYLDYHRDIIQAENLIIQHHFDQALVRIEKLFDSYDFIFLREYQVACQLAAFTGMRKKAIQYLKKGHSKGWTRKSIKKNKLLRDLLTKKEWRKIRLNPEADSPGINMSLRSDVHEMFKKDQKKALGALFRIGNSSQEKYGNRKFAPNSELQMAELNRILDSYGYPGEKLIGNSYWVSTIISHHNSISKEYVLKDTIYTSLRPKLLNAIQKGELSSFEFAIMEDWKTAVENEHKMSSFGFIGSIPSETILKEIDRARLEIGLRAIEIRNRLIDIENETGMDFYLPGKPWKDGKIELVN